MLNEMIFFETRVFRLFCEKEKVSPIEANKLFDKYGIRLKDQYCFLSQRAVDCLEVIEVKKYEYRA